MERSTEEDYYLSLTGPNSLEIGLEARERVRVTLKLNWWRLKEAGMGNRSRDRLKSNTKTVMFSRGELGKLCKKCMENIYRSQAECSRVISRMTCLERVNLCTRMETNTSDSWWTWGDMDMGSTTIWQDKFTRANGKTMPKNNDTIVLFFWTSWQGTAWRLNVDGYEGRWNWY